MKETYIICSAIKYKGHVIAGRRHGDAFTTLETFLDPEIYNAIKREDIVAGFIDNWGDFHTREEAWVIADKANQIKFGRGTQEAEMLKINFNGDKVYKGNPILISEHLFDDKDEFENV